MTCSLVNVVLIKKYSIKTTVEKGVDNCVSQPRDDFLIGFFQLIASEILTQPSCYKKKQKVADKKVPNTGTR